jgi:hypothetical protein
MIQVTMPILAGTMPPAMVRGARTFLAASATQTGQWKPTDASFMHSGQMGRPQRWQEM